MKHFKISNADLAETENLRSNDLDVVFLLEALYRLASLNNSIRQLVIKGKNQTGSCKGNGSSIFY